MKLYIIGNGFDIGHGIPCKYSDFYTYLERNREDVLEEMGQYYYVDSDSELWSDFERGLEEGICYDSLADIIPQFRSIILCDLLLYIDVTFWYLSIDLGLFWGSWFLHRHKIPHPNQWGT